MADKRIDAHTNTTTVADVDEFIVDSGSNGTRNITYSNLKDQLLGTTSIATIGNSVTEAIYNVHMDQAVPKIDTTTGVMYLEGGSAFEGNIDSTPTAGSNNAVSSGGTKTYVDNADAALNTAIGERVKIAAVVGSVNSTTADSKAIGGYKTGGSDATALSSFTGYPTGKTVVGWSLTAFGTGGTVLAVVRVAGGYVYLNTAYSGGFTVEGFVFYKD
jgi:hypothetical protein